MKRLIAIWLGKLLTVAGKIMGKKSSSGPGAIALKLCPTIVDDINKIVKNKVIITCGTNGKTTTNNIMCSALEAKGYTVLCNRIGANMLSGVATAYVQAADWLGRIKADYACFEVDEAYTPIVFKHVKPDVVVVTNLFRDQLDRYGEIDITVNLIKKALSGLNKVKVVLNSDNPVSVQFGLMDNVEPIYYGISQKVMPQTAAAKEGKFCPVCGKELDFEFYHYSQLGKYSCSCGYNRPEPDFDVNDITLSENVRFSINGESISANHKGLYSIYNLAAVYAGLNAAGESAKGFSDLIKNYRPQIGRMQEFMFNKPVILSLSKNPAGFNQAITTVNADERKKDVIIAINDMVSDGRDISWIWDVNFDDLKNENLNTLSVTGMRLYDMALRFKYADIKTDMITDSMKDAIVAALDTDSEVVYVLVNYTAMYPTEDILKKLKKGGNSNGN